MQLQVVVYGDSIAEGLRRESGSELQKHYGKHGGTAAFGISDSTAGELLWRLQDGEFPSLAMAPEAVVLMVGAQDMLRAHHPGLADQGAEIGSRGVGTIEVHADAVLINQQSCRMSYSSSTHVKKSCRWAHG